MKKESQAAIGRALGLSPASMTKLKQQGMPVDSVTNAKAWRDSNIRLTVHTTAPGRNADTEPPTWSGAVEIARDWMNIAAAALASGQCIAAMVPRLRSVLASVPVRERGAVLVHPEVMDLLTADVAAVLAVDMGSSDDAVHMDEDEEKFMGNFWYEVAAGERVVTSTKIVPQAPRQ